MTGAPKQAPTQLLLKKLIPLKQNPSLAERKASQETLRGESTEKEHKKPEDAGRRAAVYDLLSPMSKRKEQPDTDRRAGKPGEGERGGVLLFINFQFVST